MYTLGQTPRPDLVPPMAAALNAPDLRVIGVMDGMDRAEVCPPNLGNYPLKTRLSDGREVATDCCALQPRLQSLIDEQEDEVIMHVLLSVAPFQSLHSEGILIRPFEHGCRVLAANHIHEICVLVPYREQVFFSAQKWGTAGFSAHVMCMEDRPGDRSIETWLSSCSSQHAVQGLVIDHVGYSNVLFNSLREVLDIPVFDLGFEAMAFGRQLLIEFDQIESESRSKEFELQAMAG